jgi:hypothetical protein
VIGLFLTICLLTSYRPWGVGARFLNLAVLLGPILLAAGAASLASRRKVIRSKVVAVVGLLLLLIGGCPWVYTPLFYGGENSSSGMMGTMIFLLVGLPGLTVAIIGLVNWLRLRRSEAKSEIGVRA